jgi:hypothetical protein
MTRLRELPVRYAVKRRDDGQPVFVERVLTRPSWLLGDSIIVDVKTHTEIAVLKDEYGRRIVHTEKALL